MKLCDPSGIWEAAKKSFSSGSTELQKKFFFLSGPSFTIFFIIVA